MSQVLTFEGYVPAVRYDAVPWTEARVQEAAAATGPWTLIDTIALSPLDADPSLPASRDLTTSLASDTAGLWYRVVFADAGGATFEPTAPVQNTTTSALYVTRDELKATLSMAGTTYADADLDLAAAAASRAIDHLTHRRFYLSTEARLFSPGWHPEVEIGELAALTSVEVDPGGTGNWSTWTAGTQFYLDPPNAVADGRPYERLRLLRGTRFPTPPNSVRVTGDFGWPTVPSDVRQFAKIIAKRLAIMSRQETAALGVVHLPGDVGTALRISRTDANFDLLLSDYVRRTVMV